jgi:hypothetical protein
MYRWGSILILVFLISCKDREEQTSYIPSQDLVYGVEVSTHAAQMAHMVNRHIFYNFPLMTNGDWVYTSGDTSQLPSENSPWVYQMVFDSTSGVDLDGNEKIGPLHFYIYGNLDQENGEIRIVYDDLEMDGFFSQGTIRVSYDNRDDVYELRAGELLIFANDSMSSVDLASKFTYFPSDDLYRFYIDGEGTNRRDRTYKFKTYDSLNRSFACGSITKGELRIRPQRLSARNLFYDNNGDQCDGRAKVVYRRNSLTFSHP